MGVGGVIGGLAVGVVVVILEATTGSVGVTVGLNKGSIATVGKAVSEGCDRLFPVEEGKTKFQKRRAAPTMRPKIKDFWV